MTCCKTCLIATLLDLLGVLGRFDSNGTASGGDSKVCEGACEGVCWEDGCGICDDFCLETDCEEDLCKEDTAERLGNDAGGAGSGAGCGVGAGVGAGDSSGGGSSSDDGSGAFAALSPDFDGRTPGKRRMEGERLLGGAIVGWCDSSPSIHTRIGMHGSKCRLSCSSKCTILPPNKLCSSFGSICWSKTPSRSYEKGRCTLPWRHSACGHLKMHAYTWPRSKRVTRSTRSMVVVVVAGGVEAMSGRRTMHTAAVDIPGPSYDTPHASITSRRMDDRHGGMMLLLTEDAVALAASGTDAQQNDMAHVARGAMPVQRPCSPMDSECVATVTTVPSMRSASTIRGVMRRSSKSKVLRAPSNRVAYSSSRRSWWDSFADSP